MQDRYFTSTINPIIRETEKAYILAFYNTSTNPNIDVPKSAEVCMPKSGITLTAEDGKWHLHVPQWLITRNNLDNIHWKLGQGEAKPKGDTTHPQPNKQSKVNKIFTTNKNPILQQTSKAYRVEFYVQESHLHDIKRFHIWLPKSQVTIKQSDDDTWILDIPEWLMESKGIQDTWRLNSRYYLPEPLLRMSPMR